MPWIKSFLPLLVMLLLGLPLVAQETQPYSRPDFSFEFHKDWTVEKGESDFNPDTHFTLQSPGDTNIRVEVFTMAPGMSVDDLLFNSLYVLDGTLIQVAGRESIDAIGPLKGTGKHLTGKVMHVFPGGAKIFFHQNGQKGLMLTLVYWKEEYADGDKCLEVIAKTFKFR